MDANKSENSIELKHTAGQDLNNFKYTKTNEDIEEATIPKDYYDKQLVVLPDSTRKFKNDDLNLTNPNDDKQALDKSTSVSNTVDDIINQIGITWYNLKIYTIFSLFFLADGAEMIAISLLVSKLGQIWQVSHTGKGIAGSAVFVGFFIGAIVSGKLSDLKGRKPVFISGAVTALCFSICSALSPNFVLFLICRAMNGFGIGMALPSSASLATEITPTRSRAWVLNLVWIFFPLGEWIAVLIAKNVIDMDNGWRYLLGFSSCPSFLSLMICLCINESPKFYLAKKNYEKAFMGINRMLSYKHLPELSLESKEKIKTENEEYLFTSQITTSYSTLFKNEFCWLTLKISVIFYICSFVYYGLVYILPQSMEHQLSEDGTMNEEDKEAMYNGIIIAALVEIPSTVFASFLANIPLFGRRYSNVLGLGLSSVAAILSGIFINQLTTFAAMLKFAVNIPFGVIYIYTSEAYPTKIRSIAIGGTNAFTRLGGMTTPLITQFAFSLVKSLPYYLFAVASLLGAFVALTLPFETLGRGNEITFEHKTGKVVSCCLAYTVLIVNIFLPGVGTWIGCCSIEDDTIRRGHCCLGLCQFLTSVCIVGWCLACCHSCMYLTAYKYGISIEDFTESENQRKLRV